MPSSFVYPSVSLEASHLPAQMYSAPFHIKSCDTHGCFSGYASVFNELDEQGDRVLKGAFQKSLDTMMTHKAFPKMLWQHDATRPIGLWEEIAEDDRGLFVKGRLILELKKAREAYALMKERVLDSLSIGYRVVRASQSPQSKERLIQEVELFEISLVTFPANRAAKITHLKTQEHQYDILISSIQKAIHILNR